MAEKNEEKVTLCQLGHSTFTYIHCKNSPKNETPHHVLRPHVYFCYRQQLRFGITSQNMCNDLGSLFWKQELALEGTGTKGFDKCKQQKKNIFFFHQVAVQLFVSMAQWLRATTCMTNRKKGAPSTMVIDALRCFTVHGVHSHKRDFGKACWAVAGLKPLTSISALTTPTSNLFHGSAWNTFQLPLPQADDPLCKRASCPVRKMPLPIELRSGQNLRHGGLSIRTASFVQ